VAGVPLIVRVIRNLERVGVDEVVVIVGYLGDTLKKGLSRYRFDVRVRFVENDEYEKPNGTSLLKAAHLITEPTYVMMSDHLWSPDLFRAVAAYPLAEDEAVLGVDYRIERCFDLEDATKVRIAGDRIVEIGKELPRYDALDTGIFRVTPALVDALKAVEGPDGCSLSQGVGTLAARGQMRVADVQGATWIDVDTPQAHRIAEHLIRQYGDTLSAPRDVAAAQMALGA
jgi:choline kinase